MAERHISPRPGPDKYQAIAIVDDLINFVDQSIAECEKQVLPGLVQLKAARHRALMLRKVLEDLPKSKSKSKRRINAVSTVLKWAVELYSLLSFFQVTNKHHECWQNNKTVEAGRWPIAA